MPGQQKPMLLDATTRPLSISGKEEAKRSSVKALEGSEGRKEERKKGGRESVMIPFLFPLPSLSFSSPTLTGV